MVGLESGADDYLTKPFRLAELMARVRAHVRRNAPPADEAPMLRVGALEVDTAARRARVGDVEVSLRAKEFDLLARLAAEPGTAVSRTTLMSDVWDENWFGSTKTLDVHLSALRRKLADASRGGKVRAPEIVTLASAWLSARSQSDHSSRSTLIGGRRAARTAPALAAAKAASVTAPTAAR